MARCFTPEVAQRIAALRANPATQTRLDELADRVGEGTLPPTGVTTAFCARSISRLPGSTSNMSFRKNTAAQTAWLMAAPVIPGLT